MRRAGTFTRWASSVSAVLMAAAVAHADTPSFDLAQQKPGSTITMAVDAGSFTVTFTSLLPSREYHISVQHQVLAIDTIPFEAIGWPTGTAPPGARAERALACPALQTAAKALSEAKKEGDVPALVEGVQRELAPCGDDAAIAVAKALVARTKVSSVVTVATGMEAVVTIRRAPIDDTEIEPAWTITFTAPARGQWLVTYGVSIAPDRDELFFTKAVDQKFAITRQTASGGARVIPSLYFSWLPSSAANRDWSVSPTLGFGATNDAPAVMLGISTLYNHNLGLVAGVGLTQQKRLAGQYVEGQTVAENLTEDQLHRKVWRPSWVVAATLRFGSNPFANGGGKGTAAPAAPPAQKPGTGGAAPPKGTPPTGDAKTGSPAAPSGGGGTTTAGTPATEAAGALSFSTAGYRLFFTESGDLRSDMQPERAELLTAVAGATDVFVMSHGWWNSPGAADCRYQEIVSGLVRRMPADLASTFRPVFVGIYWPSVIFPSETGDCESPLRAPSGGAEALVQGSFDQDLVQWAAAAFPTAQATPSFATERSRVVELLGKERRGDQLTRGDALELARILDKWRRAAPGAADARGDGPATELFSDTPTAMVDAWTQAGPRESSIFTKALNFANAFTFWTMKERAGIVGSRGVYDVVRAIRERGGPRVRIHLVGHSFGARLLSAAVGGRGPSMNQVDSLVLLEGAFSHFAFSNKDQIAGLGVPGDKGGLFEAVAASLSASAPAVRGRMVAMYSSQDAPNRTLYPLASQIKGSDREAVRVLRYGSIGADGFQGPPTKVIALTGATRDQITAAVRDATGRMVNADASSVVLNHSDLIHDQVFDLIWAAVVTSRAAPR